MGWRFEENRLSGLSPRHGGGAQVVLTPALEARIHERTRRGPSDGSRHWTTRKLGHAMNVSHTLVAKAYRRAGRKPHRFERYMASDDPASEQKAADIIGPYVNPPQHAAVLCVDEKTAIQAVDRLDPVLLLSPGRAERYGFEWFRHGTLSRYAALNTKTGEVRGKTVDRHTSEAFVASLSDVVASQPVGRQIHVVVDNLAAHKSKRVREFLAELPNVHPHLTPTHSSWLNQVETWLPKIDRDVIARAVFTSVRDLSK